ncbi:unnamed protein product, partial [Polarella glacialis]
MASTAMEPSSHQAPTLSGSKTKTDELKFRFNKLDLNKDGKLQLSELSDLLRSGKGDMSDEEIAALFQEVDKDNNGIISFDEFVDYIYSLEPKGRPRLLIPPRSNSKSRSLSRGTESRNSSKTGAGSRQLSRDSGNASRNSSRSRPSSEDRFCLGGGPNWSHVSDAQYEQGQLRAIDALVQHLGPGRALKKLMEDLLLGTIEHTGGGAFGSEMIAETLKAALTRRWPTADPKCLSEETIGKGEIKFESVLDIVVEVMRALETLTSIRFIEIAGQIIWRNHAAEPICLQYAGLSSDVRWVAESTTKPSVIELASITFRELTFKDGGRMT